MKVIGAGFGRTGTASLKTALEELGFGPCNHMYEVFEHPEHATFWETAWRGETVDWDEVLGGCEATVDWSACTFYGELMERHPDAKVLLSVRDPDRWYESTQNTNYELTKLSGRSIFSRVGLALLSLSVWHVHHQALADRRGDRRAGHLRGKVRGQTLRHRSL